MDALNCPPLWVSFGLNPGGAGAGPWRGWRAVARKCCTPTTPVDDVTSATGPSGLSRRVRRHPSGPWAGRVGDLASATAPGRRSWPGPAPPARAPLGRVAGWSNCGPLPHHWAGGPCATVSYLGRQLGCSLVCWIAGAMYQPSAEPVGQLAGSCGWGAAAGPVLPRVDRQRGRLGRGAQPQVRNSDRHPGRSTGTVSQGQSSAEACSPPRSAASGPIATEARVTPRTG
jgi:hypothetical protein